MQAPTDRASEALARARFAVYGTSLYPDATGTLRLTYGRIEGWTHDGRTVAAHHRFRRPVGARDRRRAVRPRAAPRRRARRASRPTTLLDVAASTDTIGGSSGSPAVNAAGEIDRPQFQFDGADPAQRLWLRSGGQPQRPRHHRRDHRGAAPRLRHGALAARDRLERPRRGGGSARIARGGDRVNVLIAELITHIIHVLSCARGPNGPNLARTRPGRGSRHGHADRDRDRHQGRAREHADARAAGGAPDRPARAGGRPGAA